MTLSDALLATLTLTANILALTVLLVSFVHKLSERAQLPSLIAQYQLLSFSQAKLFAPLLLGLEAAVMVCSLALLVLGQWLPASIMLATVFIGYSLLLLSAHVRKLNLADCGCSLTSQKTEANGSTILLRNGIVIGLLLLAAGSVTGQPAATFSLVLLSLLFSVLLLIALTSLEVLADNGKKLNTLKVRHG